MKLYFKFSKSILSFFTLTAGRILGDLSNFLLFILIANLKTPEELGYYSIAAACGGFLFVIIDFGLYHNSLRQRHHSQENTVRLIANPEQEELFRGIVFRTFLFTSLMLSLLASNFVFSFNTPVIEYITIFAIIQYGYSLRMGFSVFYLRRSDVRFFCAIDVVSKALGLLIAFVALMMNGSLQFVLLSLAVTSLIGTFLIFSHLNIWPKGDINFQEIFRQWKDNLHFGYSELARLVFARSDIILIGSLLGPPAAALYNAAFRLVMMVQIVAQMAANSMVVDGASSARPGGVHEDHAMLLGAYWRLALLLGLPAASGLAFVSNGLIKLFYPSDFEQSAQLLQLLSGVILFSIVRLILGGFLNLVGRQLIKLKFELAASIAAVLTISAGIFTAGLTGAVIGLIICEGLLMFAFALTLRDLTKPGVILPALIAAITGSLVMITGLSLVNQDQVLINIVVGTALYVTTIFLFPSVRRQELAALRSYR